MQTSKEQGSFAQCPCGMQGWAVEVPNDHGTETFRDRVFHVTSKDSPDVTHAARWTWTEADRRSVGECRGDV